MAKTKVGKKIVSLVLALTMLFTVATAAVSVGARGLGENALDAFTLTSPITTAGAKTTTLAKRGAQDLLKVQTLTNLALLKNPVTQLGRFNEALVPLQAINAAQRVGDKLIIKNDALLFGVSSLGVVNNGIEAVGTKAVRDGAILISVAHKGIASVLASVDLLKLGRHSLLAGVSTLNNLAVLGHAVTHPLFLPLTHITLLNITRHDALRGQIAAFFDVADLIKDGAFFNTPISDSVAAFNEILFAANLLGVGINVAGQATGVGSIVLGKALSLHNLIDYARNIGRAARITAARDIVDFSVIHAADNFIHNALFAAALAAPVATATGVVGLTALNAGALGLAGLTAANVAGAAALAAPVAGATLAAPVALGAGALGLGGLAAAGLAGAAALAAPVVATAVAAPVVGVAALGTAAAGATALGAGVLGTAALAANVLGNKDGSTTNPVDTVKNAVESVVPSNNQTTTTATENTESTENTQNDPAQAQTTAGTSNANVANTDGPID